MSQLCGSSSTAPSALENTAGVMRIGHSTVQLDGLVSSRAYIMGLGGGGAVVAPATASPAKSSCCTATGLLGSQMQAT